MKIALALDGNTLDSVISEDFAASQYLLIVETDNNTIVETVDGSNIEGKTMAFAKAAADAECEVLISGPIEKEPFIVIADEACITRYNGVGIKGHDAIVDMENYALPLIRDHIGGEGCEDHHSDEHGCDGHHHDEEEDE